MTNPASIGQPMDRVDGPLKVTGGATYAAEHTFDQQPLVGWIVERPFRRPYQTRRYRCCGEECWCGSGANAP